MNEEIVYFELNNWIMNILILIMKTGLKKIN